MMKKCQLFSRFALGLIYFIFGSMGLAMFMGLFKMPEPQGMPESAMAFMNGIMATGYFFPVLKLTEALFGLFLLIGIAVPAALVVLAPVTLQIILFHAFLTPTLTENMLPVLMGVAHMMAMKPHWVLYKPLLEKSTCKQ